MEDSRAFNFKESYPGIPEEDIKVIQKYYDEKAMHTNSYDTFRCFSSLLRAVCLSLQEGQYIPFRQWDEKVFRSSASKQNV